MRAALRGPQWARPRSARRLHAPDSRRAAWFSLARRRTESRSARQLERSEPAAARKAKPTASQRPAPAARSKLSRPRSRRLSAAPSALRAIGRFRSRSAAARGGRRTPPASSSTRRRFQVWALSLSLARSARLAAAQRLAFRPPASAARVRTGNRESQRPRPPRRGPRDRRRRPVSGSLSHPRGERAPRSRFDPCGFLSRLAVSGQKNGSLASRRRDARCERSYRESPEAWRFDLPR